MASTSLSLRPEHAAESRLVRLPGGLGGQLVRTRERVHPRAGGRRGGTRRFLGWAWRRERLGRAEPRAAQPGRRGRERGAAVGCLDCAPDGARDGRPPGRAPMVSNGGIGVSEKTNGAAGGTADSRQQRTCTGGRFDSDEKITTGSSCRIASRHTEQTGKEDGAGPFATVGSGESRRRYGAAS
jgi:hypothetical protein